MRLKSSASAAALAAAALLCATSAQAVITIYTTQAAYLAAISAPGVDTYNDLSPTGSVAGPLNRTAGAYSYTASVGPTSTLFFPGGVSPGDVYLSTNNRTDTVTFNTFSAGVRGVGGNFFGSNLSGQFTTPSTITVTATDASGTVTQTLINPTVTSFVGFVSTGAFTNVTTYVGAAGTAGTGIAGVWPTVNNLTLGAVAAIPETQTLAMMFAGLAMLGIAVRRNKR
jgi:hypothetical protein